MSTLKEIKDELFRLRQERAAFQAQHELFEEFIKTVNAHDEPELLKSMLRKAVEVSRELTSSENGSLFLVNADGEVTDSILAREEMPSTPRESITSSVFDMGLAGWIFRHQTIAVIGDAEKDDRWLTLPNQPYKVGSAMALPVMQSDMVIGILTLTHSETNHFKPEMVDLMKITVNQMALFLTNVGLYANLESSFKSLGRAKRKIEAYSKALDSEMEKGRQIQKEFLPHNVPAIPGWRIETAFFPARKVSGDFYDVFRLPGGYLGMVIGDICDKGLGAALYMALFRSLIRIFSGQARLGEVPVDVVCKSIGGRTKHETNSAIRQDSALRSVDLTNNYIVQEHSRTCIFATIFFGVLDVETGKLLYISGGHEPVYVVGGGRLKAVLNPTGPAVGVMPRAKFHCEEIDLAPGDLLFACTDGVSEAFSGKKEIFTKQRLLDLLSSCPGSLTELLEKIRKDLFRHLGDKKNDDDMTILMIERKSADI